MCRFEAFEVQAAGKGVTVDSSSLEKSKQKFRIRVLKTNSLSPYIVVIRGIDRSSKASSLSESRTMIVVRGRTSRMTGADVFGFGRAALIRFTEYLELTNHLVH